MLGRAPATSGVAPVDDLILHVLGELLDLQRSWFVQATAAPDCLDPTPVGVVEATRADGHGFADPVDVFVEGGYGCSSCRTLHKLFGRNAQAGEQDTGRFDLDTSPGGRSPTHYRSRLARVAW